VWRWGARGLLGKSAIRLRDGGPRASAGFGGSTTRCITSTKAQGEQARRRQRWCVRMRRRVLRTVSREMSAVAGAVRIERAE